MMAAFSQRHASFALTPHSAAQWGTDLRGGRRTSVLAGMTAPHGKNNLGGSGWNTLRTAVKVTSQWGNHKEVHSHVDATDALAELSAATEHERVAHGGSPRR